MATINDFKAAFSGGGARANQFRIFLTVPRTVLGVTGTAYLATPNTGYMVRAASLPAMTLGEIAVPYRGRSIYIAGDRTFDETWSTTFLNDTNFKIRNGLEKWQNAINDLVEATGVTSPSDYQTDLTVQQLDRDDKPLKKYMFINAWPTSISAIDLSADTTDAIEEFEVTWRYQHFTSSGVSEGDPSFIDYASPSARRGFGV